MVAISMYYIPFLDCSVVFCTVCTVQVRNLVYVHTNLRLCDKVTDIDYTEQTINWSHSESESDAE